MLSKKCINDLNKQRLSNISDFFNYLELTPRQIDLYFKYCNLSKNKNIIKGDK